MIWVVLWGTGVLAFLIVFFRHRLRWLLYAVLGLVVFIMGIVLQAMLMESRRYLESVEIASRAGLAILVSAASVFVADLAAMTIYTFRQRQSGDQQDKVVTENRPLTSMSLGYGPLTGWSRRKTFASKTGRISMESLVAGTATLGERMVVRGIITLFLAFFLIWVGIGLILMKHFLFLVLIPVLPGLWVYYNLRDDWKAYRKVKRKLATAG